MQGLFNFFGNRSTSADKLEFPLYKEVAWDYVYNKPLVENGEFKVVEGIEALRVWSYKALQIDRYKFDIYSWNYGQEFERVIGKQYTKGLIHAECVRFVKECLLINPYIKGIKNVNSTFNDGKLIISCSIDTIYGETDIEVGLNV